MRISSDGRSKPSRLLRLVQLGRELRRASTRVDVSDGDHCYRFVCNNQQTLRRATTLLVKEPGTIRWLREQARPGRVFLDIGANVGVYSVFAGHQLGDTGHVYSVEPHLRNAVALMDNVVENRLQDRISVLSMALCRKPSITEFRYREWGTGSSHSQLQNGDPITRQTASVAGELKATTTVDVLVRDGSIRRPDFVKIDVDGIELAILEGASGFLSGPDPPRSVQVECEPGNHRSIEEFMADHGFDLRERHATMAGAKRIARGARLIDLPHNVIFESRRFD